MRNLRAILSCVLVVFAAAGLAAAATRAGAPAPGERNAPPEFLPQIDGPLSTAQSPDGRLWATWSIRSAGEFDVALAYRDPGSVWSAPMFVGKRDGLDEVEPSVAVDSQGALYLAYATRESSRVSLAVLPRNGTAWIGPAVISGNDVSAAPAVRLVRDRVVVAYRTPAGIGFVDLPSMISPAQILGIQDGPDGVDPLGIVRKRGSGSNNDPSTPPPPVE